MTPPSVTPLPLLLFLCTLPFRPSIITISVPAMIVIKPITLDIPPAMTREKVLRSILNSRPFSSLHERACAVSNGTWPNIPSIVTLLAPALVMLRICSPVFCGSKVVNRFAEKLLLLTTVPDGSITVSINLASLCSRGSCSCCCNRSCSCCPSPSPSAVSSLSPSL